MNKQDNTTTNISGQHFIGGNWTGKADSFTSFNPVENKPISWMFSEATQQEVNEAAIAADNAFAAYRQTSSIQKADFLDEIAKQIMTDIDDIIAIAHQETGLPLARLQGETGRTCNQLKMFATYLRSPSDVRYADAANPERLPLPKADTRLGYLPIGPVAVFGASNFPLAFSTAGGDTASALAAGCPVVVKGHPAHAATSELVTKAIARAIETCRMPAGVFNLIQSSEPAGARTLVQHPKIKAVGFTGSLKVGRILADMCSARPQPIPFYGELGSINPQFILPALMAENAESLARTQVQSMMMGHGQFCTSPGLIVALKDPALKRYLASFTDEMAMQEAAPMLTPGIAATYQKMTQALMSIKGVNVLSQGKAATASHHTRPLALTVSVSDYLANESLQDEVFGPFAVLVQCDTMEEMDQLIAALEGQLTASIHGLERELKDCGQLIENLSYKVGRLIFNQMPTGVEVCYSMNHGGPYPASTDSRSTSVGIESLKRFVRPICYQNMPSGQLPADLRPENPQLITF
ncbi:aldehyde dehydrogenase (NADP(+)) [Shewanella subflava]|uniref:Aldehyde dehydrogenase (NADP(+)) n=1 Tax=Shewanella subflava TaxID=2986476 RepID=A0ABT3I4I3_9GAMM|nr:aldehyde dehydrogenase (NADP(+)) [Shewanella subflava]MCW3170985.1 aldehyde dehydrogenase (NADP(+)) [Shewanella subflava]